MNEHWTLLSNHGLVLVTLARRPDMRLRDLAAAVGITERATQGIVADLVDGGIVERIREGRRNRYVVRGDRPLPHRTVGRLEVSDLLSAFVPAPLIEPSRADRTAVVLGCSDHRYQESLRNLMAEEGLLGRAEVLLWPGGAAALGGPGGEMIMEAIELLLGGRAEARLVLVAHQGCAVPGAFIRSRPDPLATRRAVARRRRGVADRARTRLGIEPELWFLDNRGPTRVRVPRATAAGRRVTAATAAS